MSELLLSLLRLLEPMAASGKPRYRKTSHLIIRSISDFVSELIWDNCAASVQVDRMERVLMAETLANFIVPLG